MRYETAFIPGWSFVKPDGFHVTAPQTTFFVSQKNQKLPSDFIDSKRRAHEEKNERIARLPIDAPLYQSSLFAQTVTAVNSCPAKMRKPEKELDAFAFFTDPGAKNFLLAQIKGKWNTAEISFELESVTVLDVYDSIKPAIDSIHAARTFDKPRVILMSESFLQKQEETYKPYPQTSIAA